MNAPLSSESTFELKEPTSMPRSHLSTQHISSHGQINGSPPSKDQQSDSTPKTSRNYKHNIEMHMWQSSPDSLLTYSPLTSYLCLMTLEVVPFTFHDRILSISNAPGHTFHS